MLQLRQRPTQLLPTLRQLLGWEMVRQLLQAVFILGGLWPVRKRRETPSQPPPNLRTDLGEGQCVLSPICELSNGGGVPRSGTEGVRMAELTNVRAQTHLPKNLSAGKGTASRNDAGGAPSVGALARTSDERCPLSLATCHRPIHC